MSVDHGHNIIEVKDVSFRYRDVPVLEDITLNIHRGDYLGIIGPNGGGKTTLLKIMLGLLRPQTGTVKFFGTDIQKFRHWHKVGYVPQKAVHFDAQFPATVAEVVAMGRAARRGLGQWFTAVDTERIETALTHVDMLSHKDRLIGALSPGQQQRVFIARALAAEPEVLFLDEPTVGVDANSQGQFYALLKKLNESLGLTLVLVSHDIDMVVSQVTEVACFNCRMVCYCPPKDLVDKGYLKELYGKNMKHIVHDH